MASTALRPFTGQEWDSKGGRDSYSQTKWEVQRLKKGSASVFEHLNDPDVKPYITGTGSEPIDGSDNEKQVNRLRERGRNQSEGRQYQQNS